jgi:hypothetical protein
VTHLQGEARRGIAVLERDLESCGRAGIALQQSADLLIDQSTSNGFLVSTPGTTSAGA